MGETIETQAQNYVAGAEPDGRSGILRITQDGQPVGGVGSSILGNTHPLNLYYAYGIRNSFGFDFDPITGNIWDTENGPGDGPGEGDEINLVEPGFNSGWHEVHGMASSTAGFDLEEDIVDFEGKGKYSDPEFAWINTVGPTAVKFLVSDKLGMQYVNDMFVGDVHNGRIYHFDLNEYRTDLILDGLLADKVAHTDSEVEEHASVIFGEGFGGITDLEVGPDGYLYVVSIGQGAIYRIVPGVNGSGGVTTDIDDNEQEEEVDDDIGFEEDNIGSDDEGEADEDGSLDDGDDGGGGGDEEG
jgi:glucose/arabinose dehydrogenase